MERWAVRIVASSLHDIREPDPTRTYAGAYLAFLRCHERQLDLLELVESAFAFQLNGSIRRHVFLILTRIGGDELRCG